MRLFYCAASVLVVLLVARFRFRPGGRNERRGDAIHQEDHGRLAQRPEFAVEYGQSGSEGRLARLGGAPETYQGVRNYGAALPKNDPPKGDKESFVKLAKAYASDAKALE